MAPNHWLSVEPSLLLVCLSRSAVATRDYSNDCYFGTSLLSISSQVLALSEAKWPEEKIAFHFSLPFKALRNQGKRSE